MHSCTLPTAWYNEGDLNNKRFIIKDMSLPEVIKEREEELASAFNFADQVKEQEIERWKIMYGYTPKELQAFHSQSILKVLEAVREEVEKIEEGVYGKGDLLSKLTQSIEELKK